MSGPNHPKPKRFAKNAKANAVAPVPVTGEAAGSAEVTKLPSLSEVQTRFRVDEKLYAIDVADVVLLGAARDISEEGVAAFVKSVKSNAGKVRLVIFNMTVLVTLSFSSETLW